jgi:hypothetical protein
VPAYPLVRVERPVPPLRSASWSDSLTVALAAGVFRCVAERGACIRGEDRGLVARDAASILGIRGGSAAVLAGAAHHDGHSDGDDEQYQ